jgi:hypothetical protein
VQHDMVRRDRSKHDEARPDLAGKVRFDMAEPVRDWPSEAAQARRDLARAGKTRHGAMSQCRHGPAELVQTSHDKARFDNAGEASLDEAHLG